MIVQLDNQISKTDPIQIRNLEILELFVAGLEIVLLFHLDLLVWRENTLLGIIFNLAIGVKLKFALPVAEIEI